MRISFLIFILLSYLSVLHSQDNTNIPAWVLNVKNYNSQEYAVGISDPDMDSTIAFEQAKIRALINYSIFHNNQYASLSSVSLANQQSNNFNADGIETILFSSVLKGRFSFPDSLEIVKKTITKYHEYCVLINIPQNTDAKNKTGNYTMIRRTGFQKENNQFLVVSDEIELKVYVNDTIKSTYVLNRIKNEFSITSYLWLDNKLNEVKIRNTFRNYSLAVETENPIYYTSSSSGLWAAFLYEISDKISFQSVLNKNKANKLITSEQGNLQKHEQINSLNNFILSSKKLETEALSIRLKKISVKNNYLRIVLDDGQHIEKIGGSFTQTRKSKKQLKKLKKENWTAIGYTDIETAFYDLKAFEYNEVYLSSSAELKTQGLGTGILKTLEISRTEIENQLNSQIRAVSQSGLSSNDNYSVQSSKSVADTNTKAISPYFIFFRKLNKQFYQIRVVLFYKM